MRGGAAGEDANVFMKMPGFSCGGIFEAVLPERAAVLCPNTYANVFRKSHPALRLTRLQFRRPKRPSHMSGRNPNGKEPA